MCRIIAVSGYKNSGKTTLIEKLTAYLTGKGLKVAVIKHDGHSFEPDRNGTDTRMFLDAGAYGTAVFDGEKYQIVKRQKVDAEALIEFFPEADLIFIEGLKNSAYPKIWVGEYSNAEVPNIIAWVGNKENYPCFDRDETVKIGEFVLEFMRRSK
ncbi:MAG: molybdopterin-guanine dinucleotide biosynthesis protein B [Clostridiales bacterium]|nr:molybdopterin-guanine dinucleotide biosynthesis protein B [Clostridiales bacterium]